MENTWPGKIMYSLTLPHKAWAAGDTIMALVKFAPLAKGVYVNTVYASHSLAFISLMSLLPVALRSLKPSSLAGHTPWR